MVAAHAVPGCLATLWPHFGSHRSCSFNNGFLSLNLLVCARGHRSAGRVARLVPSSSPSNRSLSCYIFLHLNTHLLCRPQRSLHILSPVCLSFLASFLSLVILYLGFLSTMGIEPRAHIYQASALGPYVVLLVFTEYLHMSQPMSLMTEKHP